MPGNTKSEPAEKDRYLYLSLEFPSFANAGLDRYFPVVSKKKHAQKS